MLWNHPSRMMLYLVCSVLCVEVIAIRTPTPLSVGVVLGCCYQVPCGCFDVGRQGLPRPFICQGLRLGSGPRPEAAADPASQLPRPRFSES